MAQLDIDTPIDTPCSFTVRASSIDDLKAQYIHYGQKFWGLVITDPLANGYDPETGELPEVTLPTPPPPAAPGRRRRSATTADAPSAAAPTPPPNGSGAAPAPEMSPADQRNKMLDVLKQCFGFSKYGSERVIQIQMKYGVKRFNEIPDPRVPEVLDLAEKLWVDLNAPQQAKPAADDETTGPFFFNCAWWNHDDLFS